MYKSRSLLRRRELLAGLGASAFLAVPVFRQSLAEAQGAMPKRLILFQWPGGVPSSCFQLGTCPTVGEGPNHTYFDFDGMLKSLAPVKNDSILFKTLRNGAGERSSAEGHEAGIVSMFTGSSSRGGDITSVDQHVAKAVGNLTRFSSLQFGGSAYDMGVQDRTVFDNGSPLPQERDPKRMFERLFGDGLVGTGGGGGTPDPAAVARLEQKKSILDYLKTEIGEVTKLNGSAEKPILDAHLEALRELEKQLTQGSTAVGTDCSAPDVSAWAPGGEEQRGDMQVLNKLQTELLYQAINCDLTRIATYQGAGSVEVEFQYTWVPGYSQEPDQHHGYQHDHESASIEAIFQGIQTWWVDQIASVINRMKATAEGSGSLLDNSIVAISSEMGNGNHTLSPIPFALFGRGNGTLTKLGQTVDTGSRNHNDLLLSLARYMGVNLNSIGVASLCNGPLDI